MLEETDAMTKDIWAEKPESFEILPDAEELRYEAHRKFYSVDGMDAFHEKLKTSFDESMADCHHSLELVAKKLEEYREKAEKWNELCEGLEYGGNTPVRDILQEINLIDRDNKLRRKKLEAVETYIVKLRNQAKKTGDIFERGFCTGIADNLEKILEGEE